MRIVIPLPPNERFSPTSGGAIATCAMQIGRHLAEHGHEVTVLADNQGDEAYAAPDLLPLRYPERDDVAIWRRALSKARYKWRHYDWPRYDIYSASVCRAIRAIDCMPDVVISLNDMQLPGRLRKLVPSATHVLWLHNELTTRHPQPRSLLRAVDHIVTNSDYIRRWTADHYDLSDTALSTIHNGVDLASFRPGADDRTGRRPVRVLCIGRIDRNKGHDLAITAVAALREQGLPVELTLAGDVWFYRNADTGTDPYLEQLLGDLSAAGGRYLGHVPREQVPAVYRDHDVVCVLSRSQEPFGLVVLEAMACGCAVIASNRGGLPEAAGGAATLVDVEDDAQVRQAVRELVESEDALMTAKRNSLERAQTASWSAAAAKFEALLQRLLNGQTNGGVWHHHAGMPATSAPSAASTGVL